MANKYRCSNGEMVTQGVINTRRSKAYKKLYEDDPYPLCQGCHCVRSQGSAHIIPQSICKQLGLTELIWSAENIFPACISCNQKAENVSSEAITTLKNFERIKEVIEKYDTERFNKLCQI